MDICLDFSVEKDTIRILSSGKIEINSDGNEILCKIYYDYSPTPLALKAPVCTKDKIRVVLIPHRVELWVNNILKDEEWPAGNCLFSETSPIDANVNVSIKEYISENTCAPDVIASFENALGWKPDENVFVGDCMPYTYGGRYHVIYLKDRHHHSSKWGLGAHQWEHISTADFKKWDIHPMAVAITDKSEGSICTGSHIAKDGIHYLYYTVRMADKSPAPVCRSISTDGYHFRKDTGFSFTLSDKYAGVNARDPKLIVDKDGIYHMLLTTTLTEEKKGCLAHLVSHDLESWTELPDPMYISDDETEPECPDYIEFSGFYYLIYSLHGKAYYLYSKNPFDGWIKPSVPLVPCSSVPKGAIWNGKIVFTGFERINCYAGTMTFKSAKNNEKGELIFED